MWVLVSPGTDQDARALLDNLKSYLRGNRDAIWPLWAGGGQRLACLRHSFAFENLNFLDSKAMSCYLIANEPTGVYCRDIALQLHGVPASDGLGE
jgi:hypothetical protein